MTIGTKYHTYAAVSALSADRTLTASSASHEAIDPNGNRNVDLPDMGVYGTGSYTIDNTAGGAEVITLRDTANSNATVGTPTQNESAVCHWSSDGTNALWICVVGSAA